MAATQMNTRIDAALKSAGDLAIREGGSTPSEVVRAVWGYAVHNRHKPQAIQSLLEYLRGEQDTEATSSAVLDEVDDQVLRGPRLIEGFCREAGIDSAALPPTTYEDLKAAAFDDGSFDKAAS